MQFKPETSRKLGQGEEFIFQAVTGHKSDNGIFYKSDDDRTSPLRSGERYDNIEDEFNALQRLSSIAPDLFVSPLSLTYDEEGNPDGYFMENAPGEELNDYTQTYEDQASENRDLSELNTDFISQQINYMDTLMNIYGESHGDLKPWNIKVDPETSRIRGYDPVGFDRETASTKMARNEDEEQIEKILSDLDQAS